MVLGLRLAFKGEVSVGFSLWLGIQLFLLGLHLVARECILSMKVFTKIEMQGCVCACAKEAELQFETI